MRVLVTGANGALGAAVAAYLEGLGHEVLRITRQEADLSSAEDCRRLAAESGAVDAVVHTAGAFAMGRSAETWKSMLATNLETSVNLFEAMLPGMQERGRGALVAVGSRAGVEPAAGVAAYGASKAALTYYAQSLALELKQTGVRVNVVMPSTIDTAANRKAMPGADASRWVQPSSIAQVIAWLISDDAADVSGAAVPVYGKS